MRVLFFASQHVHSHVSAISRWDTLPAEDVADNDYSLLLVASWLKFVRLGGDWLSASLCPMKLRVR